MQALNKNSVKTSRKGSLPPAAVVAVNGLLSVMEELQSLMGQEAELVHDHKREEHALLLKRKQRLTVDYRAGMKSVIAQPDLLKELPDDVRRALKTSAQKLSEATERNAKMLRTAVLATQRLIQNIVSIVKKEALTKPGYKDPRTAHLELGVYSPVCKPVAVSRTA